MDKFLTFGITGLTLAAIYSVIASGLVLTYTTTGIFNFAHGASGMLAAFAFWQLHYGWDVPAPIAIFIVLFILAPLFGFALERWVMRGLYDTSETVRLVVAGAAGNDTAAVDRAIDRLPDSAAARVVRTGAVDEHTKFWLLRHARALAYPSLDEGFGFPVLEAQQLGTPVVASTAGSIPQVAGAAALLSPARDVDALAANLYWIVTSDDMHAKLVRRGHANVARFSWATTARQLAAIYEELTGAH